MRVEEKRSELEPRKSAKASARTDVHCTRALGAITVSFFASLSASSSSPLHILERLCRSLAPRHSVPGSITMVMTSLARGSFASVLSFFLVISLALLFPFTAALPSATGNRVLVVIDQAARDAYSIFFKDLTSSGYQLDFKAPRDVKPQLVQHEDRG